MRYTKEFKLECVKKYLRGERIDDPGGCSHKTFHTKLLRWVRIYNCLGENGLNIDKPKLTLNDKIKICTLADKGESLCSIAISYGREESHISQIYKKYLKNGIDGLKLNKKGGPSKMKKIDIKKQTKNENKLNETKDLLQRIEDLEIENEYLKKLNALVQKRMDQQPKKK